MLCFLTMKNNWADSVVHFRDILANRPHLLQSERLTQLTNGIYEVNHLLGEGLLVRHILYL